MWQQYFDSLFPVTIDRNQNVLVIEDRRPSNSLLVSGLLAAMACLFFGLIFRPLASGGVYWLLILFLAPIPLFGVKTLLAPFREKYVFDRDREAYTFTRRALLKRQTTEGDLSQIRAVQMEQRRMGTNGNQYVFHVALLLHQGLLLGASDAIVLREEAPLGCTYESEARIAYAIADFLKVPVPDMTDLTI